ncbi:MAG: CRISPR system precrRNA processing endoribonuclease RAMP protein Cas6 [bacterium]|nr:CRISPR system precrRNA processing endoribonuclease RAMP protein Cas6 [bacterium]
MTQLKITHLRIDCIADTEVHLGGHMAGNNLRNGLVNVMRRATCPETGRRGTPTPEHAINCPACRLLAAEFDPGTVFRPYAIVPPQPPRQLVQFGERFSFGLTLFGSGRDYLPYFVLALTDLGSSEGVGWGRREGNGRFHIHTIAAIDPLRGDKQTILAPGDRFVYQPTQEVDWTAVSHIAQLHLQQLQPHNRLAIRFHTSLRLRENRQFLKTPDFGVFFKRLLFRIDQLGQQFSHDPKRPMMQIQALEQAANQVRLIETNTRWQDRHIYSGRQQRKVHQGGLTGTAVYHTNEWTDLLPWLILGQATQVGNAVVKGNGVFSMVGEWPDYWEWLQADGT